MSRKFKPVTPLRNITEVVQAVQFRGSHFFDKDTMRAFNSRLHDPVYVTKFGTFIITSEKDNSWFCTSLNCMMPGAYNNQRRYTVRFVACRRIRAYGSSDYVYTWDRGEFADVFPDQFGQFATLNAARKAAKEEHARLSALRIKDNPVLFDARQADLPPDTQRCDYKSGIQFGPWPLAEMPADATDREFWEMVER